VQLQAHAQQPHVRRNAREALTKPGGESIPVHRKNPPLIVKTRRSS
jgi:hypothetical protein